MFPVAALATVNSLTADPVAVNIISSLPLLSSITSMIGEVRVGVVKVLLVNVTGLVKFTIPKSTASVPFK